MALPYILEDRTGTLMITDFDDLYDRIFFHIARESDGTTTKIYSMGVRGSPHRDSLPFHSKPVVTLEFAADESLGAILFMRNPQIVSIPMQNYLKRVGLFGSSLHRKFTAFDGNEYCWEYRVNDGQEWSCTTAGDQLVAHYDVRPQYDPSVSGNYLTIYEDFFPLTLELLASLMIMRHIAQHNL